jgi:cytochrome c peroxidase
MSRKIIYCASLLFCILVITQCAKDSSSSTTVTGSFEAVKANLTIDMANLANYAGQTIPAYITKDNSTANPINNAKATLGRVLFYDKKLSIDNTVACASCHVQKFAFGDTALASHGVEGGLTGRHSMRLINTRFSAETKFFWDERAASLEIQTTKPMQDHAEMGYSGQSGRGNLATLLAKLQAIDYYKELFKSIYNDTLVTEPRLQECLAQFIRSIQSFDSKYDVGRAQVTAGNQPFPNFTAQENDGKALFTNPPIFDANSSRTGGGLGCDGCHKAPEFDIDPNSKNNGIIGKLNAAGIDITNTRAPSLRDIVNNAGVVNSTFMHTGAIPNLQAVIGHYGTINIAPGNTNLSARLMPNGIGQKLNLTATEVQAMIAFLKTLSGTNVYTDAKWSNPFM